MYVVPVGEPSFRHSGEGMRGRTGEVKRRRRDS